MEEQKAPVRIVELEERVLPDNSFEGAYAIYLRLSHEPSPRWQSAFESLMRREVRHRITSFVGDRLRVVVSRRDNLALVLRQMEELTRRANIELDLTTPEV